MDGLRPLAVGELLDAAFKIYRSRAKTLLAAVAIPVVPVLVFSSLVSFSSQASLQVDPVTGQPNFDGGDLALTLVGLLVSVVAATVGSAVATAACMRSISGAYVGDDPDWRTSLRFGFSRLGSVVGLSVVSGLATLVGLAVCVLGAIVPLTWFAVAMPVLLVEGTGIGAALGRSRDLARGSFWRVCGIVLLGMLLAMAFQATVSMPLVGLFLVDASPAVIQIVNALVSTVAAVLVTPFSAALTMALYVDLRVRKEGFDLVLWAQRLGAGAGPLPPQPGAPAGPAWGEPAHWQQQPTWAPTPPPPPPPPPPPAPPAPPSGPAGWGPPPGS